MAVPPPPPVYTPFDVLKFLPESQASGVDFCHFQFLIYFEPRYVFAWYTVASFSRIVQRSIIIYKNPDSWKKRNSFFTCRSDVISQTVFFTHAHTRKKHDKISQRFICFPTFISKMGGIVTFLCKLLDCAARVLLENATYVNNSFTKFLTV